MADVWYNNTEVCSFAQQTMCQAEKAAGGCDFAISLRILMLDDHARTLELTHSTRVYRCMHYMAVRMRASVLRGV